MSAPDDRRRQYASNNPRSISHQAFYAAAGYTGHDKVVLEPGQVRPTRPDALG